jgi:aspartyl-tRNA(Asn)/glutamyl-tRNA(Gln) amidotransferase subunit C
MLERSAPEMPRNVDARSGSSFMLASGMPAPMTRADVERIAALAHLALGNDEVQLFTKQLGDILGYARDIASLHAADVPATAARPEATGERPDVVTPSLARAEALRNAPDAAMEAGLFKEPRVIGG